MPRRMPSESSVTGYFQVVETQKVPGMQYRSSIFGNLLKPIDRRQFREIVERHDADAYDKSFKSWDHMVTLVGAQLGCITSLRGLELAFNANSHQHYHLGVCKVARSTLSDANARRPAGVFAETFAMLAGQADRRSRVEGAEMVRLIDSSPIPVSKMCKWAEWNGRIRGMKMHVVYHPGNDVPRCIEMTDSTINDVEIGRQTELEAGATYVFDKGYYHFGWWKKINATKAFFVTLVTNDLERTAVEIAALYKGRWQIELLFRWIKQHLNLRKLIGNNRNAISLQVIAAMIAYLLLRIAKRLNSLKIPDLRFAELVRQRLFMRSPISEIDKPPPVNPSKSEPKFSIDQLWFKYA